MTKEIFSYPLPNPETEPHFADHLTLLVEEQKQALQDGEFVPESADGFKKLRSWFKKTDQFDQIYLKSSIYFCTPRTDEQIAEFRKYFAGCCYEIMSYFYHAPKQPEGLVLLSPSRTLAFYESLFPEAQKFTNPLGLDSLRRISVPDGLQIQENRGAPKILRVIEYTLTGSQDYLQKKIRVYGQRVQQFPELFGKTQLVFVMPSKSSNEFIPPVIQESKARVIEMPFTRKQFRKFDNGIFEHYRPGANYNRPTLNEIQESMTSSPH